MSSTSSTDPNCLFCKIVAGSIPSSKVYEDESVYAFLDIIPVNAGHTLVIPKRHSADMTQMSKEEVASVFSTVQLIGAALKGGLKAEGYNVLMNNGKAAGQEVMHAHAHVIPQSASSTRFPVPIGQKYPSAEEQKRVADTIAASVKVVKP